MTTIRDDQHKSRLHELLDRDEIEELHKIFKSARNERFTEDELRNVLSKFHITYNDEEFHVLFLKINTNRNNFCDWDEFISYLILNFQDDDPYNQQETLDLPIARYPKVLKGHRHPILKVTFCPNVLPDRSTNNVQGSYVTVSKDGTVNYRSLDLDLQRSGKSKNPFLKVAQTWVLDAVCLPDVRIFCTSSTERDLRFYDTTANNFHLRIIITSLPFACSSLSYYFRQSLSIDCKLLMGDYGGNIRILTFNALLRGPFQSKPGTSLVNLTYNDVVKGKLPMMHVTEYIQLHADIIRQVEYVECINSFISASECPPTTNLQTSSPGIMICEIGVQQTKTAIKANKGMTCFAFDEKSFMLATGGPDTILRLWNPIVPQKATAILPGHHAGITFIFIQDTENGKKVYSMDKNKVIKVWDVREQNLLQTYIALITALPDRNPTVAFYNDDRRELIVAGMKIATTKCCPLLRVDLTDGNTHSRPVSVVLYNELFKVIVSCGLDSFIIVWDYCTGKRLKLIKMAHTRIVNGEILRVEITAACFDPKHQLLLTGARNGTLKVWNFNNGVCIRNLSIESMCEVTAVIWVKNRMLAVGWNRHVTEFADSGDTEYGKGKEWDICHVEDILAIAKSPQTLATSSYSGEIVLWKLETGQPYRRYDVGNPEERIKIHYEGAEINNSESKSKQRFYNPQIHKIINDEQKLSERIKQRTVSVQSSNDFHTKAAPPHRTSFTLPSKSHYKIRSPRSLIDARIRKLSIIKIPDKSEELRPLAVQSMVFLENRPMNINYGSLFVALENGIIQVYSHHKLGGYMDYFNAVHMAGDCVSSMVTDKDNKYLFTATVLGYIKIWLVINYCVPNAELIEINKPILHLKFPFLIKDRIQGRAKRSVENKKIPKLLNSFKGHLNSINSIIYIDETEIILSASSDYSVRLWTIGGRYIGTLGSPITWSELSSTEPLRSEFKFRMPPDIKRSASFTTKKVLRGGEIDQVIVKIDDPTEEIQFENDEKEMCIYGKPLSEPILGKHFELPSRGRTHLVPVLDKSLPYIPIYTHLDIHHAETIDRPKTPEVLVKTRTIDFMSSDNNNTTTEKDQ